MSQLTQHKTWKLLKKQRQKIPLNHEECSGLAMSSGEITLDCSMQHLNTDTFELLLQLAEECHLKPAIEDLFSGKRVNTTENRPALHTALRLPQDETLYLDGKNIIPDIMAAQDSMKQISEKIRAGEWLGYSNKPIKDIVNIGIGGSHTGPAFCVHALAELALPSLSYHFISDMDAHAFHRVTAKLSPETTLFIVASKSFTTMETLYNTKKAMAWINKTNSMAQHFIAVTAHVEKAYALGIKNVLPIWDWVGGRYSLCSAINLITCIAIGFERFSEFVHGAYLMDNHFRYTPFKQNLPVNLALFGIWNNNFLKIHQLLVMMYGSPLDYFSSYVQQLDMESNGKSINKYGQAVDYATAPIIWGGSGNQAQHSYYQLLCQGTHRIAAELISIDSERSSLIHRLCLAQKEVLSKGDKERNIVTSYPISHISLRDDSPKTLGALIALYEHKIYTQSVIWQINAFDQPGVESSKLLMQRMH